MDLVKLIIKGISFSQTQTGAYALILEEEIGDRKLPIIIGNFEAQSIALALEKDIKPPRPITHDLFAEVAKSYHIKLKMVQIYKLVEGVFYSNMYCEGEDGEEKIFDSRTSDSIAMAVRFNAPIYTTTEVMDKAGIYLEMRKIEDEKLEETIQDIENQLNLENLPQDDVSILSDKELNDMMNEALSNENYELAAKLRDELNKRKK